MQLTSPSPFGFSWQLNSTSAFTRFGRWFGWPMLARSVETMTLSGMPLWIVVTPPTCQPPSTPFSRPLSESL